MRKLFALVLIALLVGVGVVAMIETEPGYVLVSYGSYTLETSLWVGALLLLLFTLLVYGSVGLVRRIIGGQKSLAGWLGARKSRQAGRLTTRGMISFIEGNWSRARRQLLRGARGNEAPLINYLMAARASYSLDEPEKMREYLGAAGNAESEAGIAVELTQAELKLQAGQYEQALATLVRARRNAGRHPHVLNLMSKAYYGLRDWDSLAALMPELKKYQVLSETGLAVMEREACAALLVQSAGRGAEGLQGAWQSIPNELKQDGDLLRSYVSLLIEQGEHAMAEKVIRRALKQQWDSGLARLYGLAESDDTQKQLAQAESWLVTEVDDAQLFLALGRLAARARLWGKARDYFESSYRLERSPETCAELGRLLTALGEPKVAAAYFREGLLSKESDLPALPMPEKMVPGTHRLIGNS